MSSSSVHTSLFTDYVSTAAWIHSIDIISVRIHVEVKINGKKILLTMLIFSQDNLKCTGIIKKEYISVFCWNYNVCVRIFRAKCHPWPTYSK